MLLWPISAIGARGETKPIAHSLGIQIPYRLGTQEAAKKSVEKTAQRVGDNSTAVVGVQRGRGCGRDVVRGPYPHMSCDSSQVFGIIHCGVRQRQECHDIV